MKNRRLTLLGIDGMDFDYTQEILDDLPNLKKLGKSGLFKPFRSVFPPDSIPSWITCYTGKDPSEHGILESVNYLAKGNERLKVDTSAFKGKTFWDILSHYGKTVCVINPFMAYPVWPVNGVMVNGPVFIDGKVDVSDWSMTSGLNVPDSLGGITDFPTKKTLSDFVKKTFEDTKEQAEFGMSMLKRHRPDLFFQTFLTMDRIQHFLWRFCDSSDPTYPGVNEFEDAIREFYIGMDGIVGKYLEVLGPEEDLMIISDHGHGMRCTHCFNINEVLRNKGYVKSSADGKAFSSKLLIEKLKNSVLGFMDRHNLEDYINVIAKIVPNAGKLKKGKHITDDSKNIAFASDFTGTNPFGGICINKSMISDYHNFRDALMTELHHIKDGKTQVFQWIKKREDLFHGEFIERYPDIIFSLNSKYGVNWSLHTKYFTVNPTHKKISGGHKEYGVFFSNLNGHTLREGEQLRMTDFFATVLTYFGIDASGFSNGRNFL